MIFLVLCPAICFGVILHMYLYYRRQYLVALRSHLLKRLPKNLERKWLSTAYMISIDRGRYHRTSWVFFRLNRIQGKIQQVAFPDYGDWLSQWPT